MMRTICWQRSCFPPSSTPPEAGAAGRMVNWSCVATIRCYCARPLAVGALDAADEIPDHMDLVHIVVRDLHAGELIFDRDHQFHAIEPIGTEIVGEVCVIRDAFDADAQMLGDDRTELA